MTEAKRDKIFGWTAGRDGCEFYRILQPFSMLAENGYNVEAADVLPEAAETFDVIVGQRVSKPGTSVYWQTLAKRKRTFLIYESDDDLFNPDITNERAYYFFTHPQTYTCMEENLRASHLVTVSTEPLAQEMRKYNSNVVVIPNFIDQQIIDMEPTELAFFHLKEDGNKEKRDVSDKVTIGYASSPTHEKDFALIKEQLYLTAHKNPQILYLFFGTHYDMHEVDHANFDWAFNMYDHYNRMNFDIGLAPLADTRFNKSKSYIKALEYASFAIPVVASDEPPYHDFVKHGETGFLCKQPYQFGKYLNELTNDEAMRKEMGQNAKKLAQDYTIQKNWHFYEEAYGLRK